jgi:carboxypeptidase Q
MRNGCQARCCILILVCLSTLIGSRAVAQGTSTPEERMQWVEVTHKLENAPLDDIVNKQGEVALKQVSDAHDIHVPLCPALLSEFNGMKYTYSHTITRQYMLASTAFLIENPDKAADTNAMNLAAVESVLKTYQAILQQKPDAKAKALDDLLKKQSQGKLKDSVQKQCQ